MRLSAFGIFVADLLLIVIFPAIAGMFLVGFAISFMVTE